MKKNFLSVVTSKKVNSIFLMCILLTSCATPNTTAIPAINSPEFNTNNVNVSTTTKTEENEESSVPKAKIIPEKKYYTTETYIDNYSWMKDKTNPDFINYLAQENKYADNILEKTTEIQEQLYREMVDRINLEETSIPEKIGNYYYYQKNLIDQQYPLYCRKFANLNAREEIILDMNKISLGKNISFPGDFKVSPDNKYLAFSIDREGTENYRIYIKNLSTGELLNEEIPNTYGNIEWTNDSKYFYYSILDSSLRPYKIIRHRVGRSVTSDLLVYHEKDKSFSVNTFKTNSKAFITINSESINSNEIRYIGAKDPSFNFKLFQKRKENIKYYIQHNGSKFYILTNSNAKSYKVMAVNVLEQYRSVSWEQIIPTSINQTLNSFQSFKNNLVIFFRENGLAKIKVFNLRTNKSYVIDFNEPSYSLKPVINNDYNSDTLSFSYSSFISPQSIYQYDLAKKTRKLLREDRVRYFNPNNYQVERIYVTSRDRKRIPISLIYKKSLKRNNTNPLLLNAYGAYGENNDPKFEIDKLSLIDRGYIYAIAHVRGGGELGINWYEDGKLFNKKNSINDLADCAEQLISRGYTNNQKVNFIAKGAGALIAASLINEKPDLFNKVLLEDPFLDILNTMKDSSLPLTIDEYNEWGNPNRSLVYNYIKSYSPYDNIIEQIYPSIMVTAGINNSVIGVWESSKYIAKLRSINKKNNLVLKTYTDAGHKGKIGEYDYYKRKALEYSFLLMNQ